MIPLSNVDWGPEDAINPDKLFSKKWIETPSAKACLMPDIWLISGEKGVGKTAIRKAIHDIYGDDYFVISIVDFNDITFRVIYQNLLELSNTTHLSKTRMLSHYWQYSMMLEIIKECAQKGKDEYQAHLDIVPKSNISLGISERLIKLLEDAWNIIDDFTGQRRSDNRDYPQVNLIASGNLSADLISQLNKFPLDSDFIELREKFFRSIENNQHKVILILDGFDKLRNDGVSSDAIKLIFGSLVDAVLSIRYYSNLPKNLEIKAFIPHDRYVSLSLRDSDKVDGMHVGIQWNRLTLQEFLRRRLELTPKLMAGTFSTLWRQVMPEKVHNSHYKLDEDTFDYIVRHTMLRPRHLQIHLSHLAKENIDLIVDPSSIPKSIADSSRKIARFYINEYQVDHPNLDKFIKSLRGKDNIIEFKELRNIVKSALDRFSNNKNVAVDEKIDALYSIGFFGVVNFINQGQAHGDAYCPPTRESRRHYVEFFYQNPHTSISSSLEDDSPVAFHPIFLDYANLRPHPSLIVG